MINFKKRIKSYLKGLIGVSGAKIYKLISLVKRYSAEKKAEELISQFQSSGYGVKLNGFDWYVSSPDHLVVGNNVHIGDGAYLKTDGGLIIGDNVHISRNLTIYTENHDYYGSRLPYDNRTVKEQVIIEKNVWIGINVSILPGVTIGEGAIIGMGAVVSRDVEPNEIVGLPEIRTLKKRDKEHYNKLNKFKRYGGINGTYINVNKFYPSYLEIPSNKLFFVLGTGRCGSKSIAANLNKHKEIYASHEEIHQFIRLSTQLAHNEKESKVVKEEVVNIFKNKTFKNHQEFQAIIHSDQRIWNLAPIFKEIFPKSNFIHLIRNGRDTVRSMFARRWYLNYEFELKGHQWSEYRLDGHLAGNVDEHCWKGWDSFEKICWYWSFINDYINEFLKKQDNSFLIMIEKFDKDYKKLLQYLNVREMDLNIKKYNLLKSKHSERYKFNWNKEKEEIFQNIAGEVQSKFYQNEN